MIDVARIAAAVRFSNVPRGTIKKRLHNPRRCGTILCMKTTRKPKSTHLAFRIDADALAVLDDLCEDIGSPGRPATRSRILRRIIMQYAHDWDILGGLGPDGHPVDRNQLRREFVARQRRLDDALIDGLVAALRSRGAGD